jgi:hypothetical protein
MTALVTPSDRAASSDASRSASHPASSLATLFDTLDDDGQPASRGVPTDKLLPDRQRTIADPRPPGRIA